MASRGGREASDWQRIVGGLLFAVGALVVLLRSAGAPHWTEFERVLVVCVPVVVLYALAVGPRSLSEETGRPGEAAPWRAVLLVVAVLLSPVAMLALLHWLGVDTHKKLIVSLVFVLAAMLGALGSQRSRSPYGMLLAAIAIVVAWLIVWSRIIHNPSGDDYRWLLLGAAVLLAGGAAALTAAGRIGAGEIGIVAALSAVVAGALGIFIGEVAAVFLPIASSSTCTMTAGGHESCKPAVAHVHGLPSPFSHISGLQHFGWDLFLLAVSILVVIVGVRGRIRGLGYVGALGLALFTLSVGSQLARLEGGKLPNHALVGWPLALVVLGALALITPAFSSRRAR